MGGCISKLQDGSGQPRRRWIAEGLRKELQAIRHPQLLFPSHEPGGKFELDGAYETLRRIGRGGTGDVWLCRCRQTRELYAIKLQRRPLPPLRAEEATDEILIQADVGNTCVNCTGIREAILTHSYVAMVLQNAAGGSLTEFVARRMAVVPRSQLCVSEELARYLFRQLLHGVRHLHRHRVAHRDIKLDNCLLDGSDPPVLQICDFQFARRWPGASGAPGSAAASGSGSVSPDSAVGRGAPAHSPAERTHSHLGTACYMAPELLMNRMTRGSFDAGVAEVWASGILLLVMLLGAFPFDSKPGADERTAESQILGQEMHGSWRAAPSARPYLPKLSAPLADLLDGLLQPQPEQRLSLERACAHPWVAAALPPRMQAAWERIEAAQAELDAAVYASPLDRARERWVRAAFERAAQAIDGPAALGLSPEQLEEAQHLPMLDATSIPGAIRIDLRREAVTQWAALRLPPSA